MRKSPGYTRSIPKNFNFVAFVLEEFSGGGRGPSAVFRTYIRYGYAQNPSPLAPHPTGRGEQGTLCAEARVPQAQKFCFAFRFQSRFGSAFFRIPRERIAGRRGQR